MEQNKRTYAVIAIISVLAILLSTCFGAFAGGIAGYWAGRQASKRAIEKQQPLPQEPEGKPIEPELPPLSTPEGYPFIPSMGGALITKVVDGSPADQAGIKPGDFIVAVDGIHIEAENSLDKIIREHQPGDRVEVTLWRQGRERTVKVELGTHPERENTAYLGVYYLLLPAKMTPFQIH